MKNKMLENLILDTDSYKFSHYAQYPENTQYVYSYIEARKPANMDGHEIDYTVFYGMQYILDQFTQITHDDVDEAKALAENHGVPFYEEGWRYIVDKHNGLLPILIDYVNEGEAVPVGNVLVTVVNTDPKCFWLTSYIETMLVRVWYPTTVATISHAAKRLIYRYLKETSDDPNGQIPFKLHDFGSRGVTCREQAALGGSAHLVNFLGTDTVIGMRFATDVYSADPKTIGFSIPASEHSTMTSWGKENETAAYRNMIDSYAKEGSIFACVSDSYDIYNAVKNIWAKELLPIVKKRGATVVIRPDSGDPVETPIRVLEILMEELKDEVTVNSKGYRVLPSHVRVIQGDGMTFANIDAILSIMKEKKMSADNIAFGMGAGLLQKVDRDTFSFAMKCSAAFVYGKGWIDVYKDPVGMKSKQSKRGIINLYQDKDDKYVTMTIEEAGKILSRSGSSELTSRLNNVFCNGKTSYTRTITTFDQIREIANSYLEK